MAKHNIGAVPVVEGTRLVGIFSERDYARKVVLKGLASTSTPVQAIMTAQVQCAGLQDSVMGLMDLMTQQHFRHMPVLDQDRLLGILSMGDLVKAVIEDQHQQIQHLQDYIRA
jgi:CBS domain-containing protein